MAKESFFKYTLPVSIKNTFGIEDMGKKWKMNLITLRYNGLFNFDGMYSDLTDWAKRYGYRWHESSYKHKVPSTAGAEQEFIWIFEKDVNDFVRYTILITAKAQELTEITVDIGNGKKKTLSNAKIEIKMNGHIDFDWQKKFSKGKWAEVLGPLYMKIMNKEFEIIYYDQLYYRMWNLHSELKKRLDMSSKHYAYKGSSDDS